MDCVITSLQKKPHKNALEKPDPDKDDYWFFLSVFFAVVFLLWFFLFRFSDGGRTRTRTLDPLIKRGRISHYFQ